LKQRCEVTCGNRDLSVFARLSYISIGSYELAD